MNKTMKKALSLVIVMIMVVSSVPMAAFAAKECSGMYDSHDFGTYVTTTAPTCSAKGVATATCRRILCNATDTKELAIEPTAHKLKDVTAKEAECTKPGHTEGVICEYCLITVRGCEIIPAKGHTSVAFEAKEATCTEDGITAGKRCSVCDAITEGGVKLPATGHNFTEYTNPHPNCKTKTDGEKVKACLTCGYKEAPVTVPWSHSYGSWKTETAATCKTEGVRKRICLVCGVEETSKIDKLNHTIQVIAAKDATCETAGNTAGKKCTKCDYEEGNDPIPAKGHTLKVVNGVAATCTAKGKTDATICSVCNKTLTAATEIKALGHDMVKVEASSVDATCTTTGTLVKKCSRCTETTTETVPKTHDVSWTILADATCTKDGKRMGYCANCSARVEEVIPATGHKVTNNASWITTKEATCTKAGEKQAQCSVCKENVIKTVPATDHTIVVYKLAEEPTCEKVGYTESKYCSVCKTVTTPAEEIPKTDHKYGEWTVVKSATCAAAGIEKATCTVCKVEKTKTVDRLPHKEKVTAAVEPTCLTAGKTESIDCEVCGAKVKESEAIPALGHDLVKDEAACREPDCTQAGWIKAACSRCDFVQDEAIAALGHKEEVIAATPADCMNTGISEGKKCTVCGEITVEQTTVPALGHDLVADPAKSTAATCTEKGMDFLDCTRCDYTEPKEVPPLEHTWGEWEEVTAASCDEKGLRRRVCATCNTVQDEDIPSLGGHQIVTSPGYAATCTEPGKTNGAHCEICNTVIELQEDIDPLGHDTTGAEYELVKATVDKEGIHAIYCNVCGEPDETTKSIIPQIDEKSIKLSTAKCTYNGKKRTPSVSVKDVDGEDLVEGEDFEVEYPSGRKDVGEYTITVKFIGNYDGEYDLKFVIAPGKTSKITATSSQKDYVKISWNKVAGATGYRLYIYKTVDGKTRKKVVSVTGTSYNLKKDYAGKALEIGAEYKVAVTAYTKLEDDTVIHALAGVAKTFTRTPGKPSITSISSASGKAKLTWSDVKGETAYQVWYSTKEDGEYKKAGSGLTSTTYSKSFTKGKTIYLKVRAYTKVDGNVIYGSFSSVKSVTIK